MSKDVSNAGIPSHRQPGWEINIGTILLERNRWNPGKPPVCLVSEWVGRFAAAGFDGMELWANHALQQSEAERRMLQSAPLPVAIYNTYAAFDDESLQERRQASDLAASFHARGVKFNFGNDTSQIETYARNLRDWIKHLPPGCRPLCECHPRTVLEKPDEARRILDPFGDAIGIIVHVFAENTPLSDWFQFFGRRVGHVHVARSEKNGFVKLVLRRSLVRERLDIMRAAGFRGSLTIEFTEGVACPSEDMNVLLRNATEDMLMLREELSR